MKNSSDRLNALAVTLRVAAKRRSDLRKKKSRAQGKIGRLQAAIATRKKALLVIEYLINKKYDKVIRLFEHTVTSALIDLFDSRHSFKFKLGRHGDNVTCDFAVNTGKYKGYLPVHMTQGNSIKEIIAVIISTIVVKLDKTMPKFIILDEQLGGLRAARQVAAGEFLKKVCKTFGVQYIVVTQSEDFAVTADNFIDLEKVS